MADHDRFRLTRGGVLNVWQYDEQVFDFAGGRLLLRGANGAGKSKTMEMLLPFVIDGDKSRLTSSGRHHTSLLWLMLDGYDGAARTGYLWVELTRRRRDGETETVTCGVGIKATASARAANAWFFTSPHRVGEDLLLEDEAGPLSQQRLKAEVEVDGHYFESPRRYRDHVGRLLFGLPPEQYDELLRLLYWLRQPQVGEDIDPKRLAEQLVQALPQVDGTAVRTAGDTFDELGAFGEQIERRARAASAIGDFVETYPGYARAVLAQRGTAVIEADTEVRRRRTELRRTERALAAALSTLEERRAELGDAKTREESAAARIVALENGPEARTRQRLLEMGKRVAVLESAVRQAELLAEESRRRAAESADRADRDAASWAADARRLHGEVRSTAAELSRSTVQVGPGPAAELGEPALAWPNWEHDTPVLDAATAAVTEWVSRVGGPLGELKAAVTVVERARRDAEAARSHAVGLEEQAARVETRVEAEQERARAAAVQSRALEGDLAARLASWQAHEDAVIMNLPELTAEGLAGLEAAALSASAARTSELQEAIGLARASLAAAESRRVELSERRQVIQSEVDPAPAAPAWHRASREGRAGAPLWRLVDFREGVPAGDRAGLEAALDGAGLLDAWVNPDGRVERAALDDLVLVAHELQGDVRASVSEEGHPDEPQPDEQHPEQPPATEGHAGDGSLATVLRPDVPAGGPVPETLVTALLWAVRLGVGSPYPAERATTVAPGSGMPLGTPGGSQGASVHASASDRSATNHGMRPPEGATVLQVDVDGRWRAGSMVGRTSKPVAQFIGTTARAAERARRLAVVDEQLQEAAAEIEAATAARTSATHALERIEAWLASRPRHEAVLRAWAAEEERHAVVDAGVRELTEVTARAAGARGEAAERHTALERLADMHGLPITADGLQTRAEQLRAIGLALESHARLVTDLRRRLTSWAVDAARACGDRDAVTTRSVELAVAEGDWARVRDQRVELARTEGSSVTELEERLRALGRERVAVAARIRELEQVVEGLITQVGRLGNGLENDEAMLAAAQPALEAAREALGGLGRIPGLVAAAGLGDEDDSGALASGADLAVVRRLLDGASSGRHADANSVLQAAASLQSGAAAVNEPRVLDIGGVLAAVGRDDSGELPMVELARRLAASVAADRDLLSERERTLFENHVLGHLGDALRGVRLKAAELVQAMNDQLHDVTTSQEIRVRLRWRLRDDIPAEARRAVQLLGEPLGALLPDERAELRDSLHRLIEVSRAEAPEESYAEHLARALDYRQWYAFTVQYHRPETGEWRDLQRKTALSQGEQKVLCYLPLFAAAAAHFASLAGAAPHAPRFVLLDDAFPKIDVRTHPLLFGLLVDLDLDFVVTSERLWGTHATVPELAIYEALRSPTERGIAQYEHRWDGHQLTAVGR